MHQEAIEREIREFKEYLLKNTLLNFTTIKLYCSVLRDFLSKYNEVSLNNINNYIAERLRKSNVNYIRASLINYIKAKDLDIKIEHIIKPKWRERKRHGNYMSHERVMKLINAIEDKKFRLVALLQYLTGARAREILTIKIENIKIEDDFIRIALKGKGNRTRYVFVDLSLKEALEELYNGRDNGYLFFEDAVIYEKNQEEFAKYVWKKYIAYMRALKKACEKLNINFSTHDFRRNFADRLYKNHKDLLVVKEALGHADVKTTMRYFASRKKEVINAMLEHQKNVI